MGYKQPIVSIVMPVYNAARYVEQSIRCILNQTVDAIELVVVDDCSTDGSWEILSKASVADPRIRLYRLPNNSGSAKYPRDLAVSKAEAPWICWIDADDTIPTDYLQQLLERQHQTNADIVCSTMNAVEDNGNCRYTLPRSDFDINQVADGQKAVMWTIGDLWTINMNGCMVRKEIWELTSLFLNKEIVHMNADDYGCREMLMQANVVAFSNVQYYYRVYQDSITKALSYKLFEPLITDVMTIDLFTEKYGEGSIEVEMARRMYYFHWISMARLLVLNHSRFREHDKRVAIGLLKEHHSKFVASLIIKDKTLTLKRKFLLLLPYTLSIKAIKLINKS